MREIIMKQAELNSTKVADDVLNFGYTKHEQAIKKVSGNTAIQYSYTIDAPKAPTARIIGIAYESIPAMGGCIGDLDIGQTKNMELGSQLLYQDNEFRLSVNQSQGLTPDAVIINETLIELGSNRYNFNADNRFALNSSEMNIPEGLELNDNCFKISRCDNRFEISNSEHTVHIVNFNSHQNIYFSTSKYSDTTGGLFSTVINV